MCGAWGDGWAVVVTAFGARAEKIFNFFEKGIDKFKKLWYNNIRKKER